MNNRSSLPVLAIVALSFTGIACVAPADLVLESGAAPSQTIRPTRSAAPASQAGPTTSADLVAISASAPSAGAADAIAKCHIGDMIPISEVSGMAQLSTASEITHYVPLTGREPQLRETGPVWVLQIRGDVQEPGGEIWTDPTCIVTQSDYGYVATGPVKTVATGSVLLPEAPATPPDRVLPTLAP